MHARETITDYYARYAPGRTAAGQVSVHRIEDFAKPAVFPLVRRDFYKIKLLNNAQGVLTYADQHVAINASALVFVNPQIPYSWQRLSGSETGFTCWFTEDFLTQQLRPLSMAGSPLFRVGGTPVLFPSPAVVGRLSTLFELLLTEVQSPYVHKYDLVRNYVHIILHESLKLLPAAPAYPPLTPAARLSARFLDLLNRQFPVTTPHQPLPLKNANEFAQQLAVHPNHLNKALSTVTAKTTTQHVAERIFAEAKALLQQHSDWSIADIGYCLGFEHASNFVHFFKKQAGQPPHHYRQQPGALSSFLA